MNVNKDRKKYVYSEALDPIISNPSIPEAAPVTPVSAVFPPRPPTPPGPRKWLDKDVNMASLARKR